MGMTEVSLTIKNPQDPKLQTTDKFLVDSGAALTVLPKNLVKKLNLKPLYEREFSLADGKVVRRKIGTATIRFKDEELPSPVILGEEKDNKLLGAITLEIFGLALDPFERKIYKARLML